MTNQLISAALAALVTAGVAPTAQAATPPTAVSPAPAGTPGSCTGMACGMRVLSIAHRTEVPVAKNVPYVKGRPLTSVVVTQCNLIVAVYLTMPDGRLLRFDHTSNVPAEELIQMAYTAARSERVEVSCNDSGAVGYEQHNPV